MSVPKCMTRSLKHSADIRYHYRYQLQDITDYLGILRLVNI